MILMISKRVCIRSDGYIDPRIHSEANDVFTELHIFLQRIWFLVFLMNTSQDQDYSQRLQLRVINSHGMMLKPIRDSR